MHHLLLPSGRNLIRERRPVIAENRAEARAETLLVERERCFAVAVEVEIRADFHVDLGRGSSLVVCQAHTKWRGPW